MCCTIAVIVVTIIIYILSFVKPKEESRQNKWNANPEEHITEHRVPQTLLSFHSELGWQIVQVFLIQILSREQ